MSQFDRKAEVLWGEGQEERICDLWRCSDSELGQRADLFEKGPKFADYDFKVYGDGRSVCYLEVKVRRLPFARYGDVLLPARKHEFACQAEQKNVPCVAVVLFACGTLVEVDLKQEPDERPMVQRKGRQRALPHHLFRGDKVRVLST